MIEVQNRGGVERSETAAVLYLKHPQGQAEGKKKKKIGAGGARPKQANSTESVPRVVASYLSKYDCLIRSRCRDMGIQSCQNVMHSSNFAHVTRAVHDPQY